MKTNTDQKTFVIGHTILRGFICAILTFTAFNALSSTNTVQVSIKVRFVQLHPASDWPDSLNWWMLACATNRGPTFAVNITRSQFQTVLKKLEQRDGADLINEGQVTTQSGRSAQFQVVDTSVTPDMYAPTSSISNGPNNVSISRDPKNNPFGTTLDLLPTVSDDGSTIDLVLIPTTTEFLGTNYSWNSAQTTTYAAGRVPITGPLPLPHSRVRQITISGSRVKDGQTLVLGDFQGKPNSVTGKNLLIFVTPTLIDSTGRPVHSNDYYDSPIF